MFQQWFLSHARAMIDHSGVTGVCDTGSRSYCCDKDQGFDGCDHEHRKILVCKHKYILMYNEEIKQGK